MSINSKSLLPLPLETKFAYISRFSGLDEAINQHPNIVKRRIVAGHKWEARASDKHTMVKISLASGDSYLIRENDNLSHVWMFSIDLSARGAKRNGEQY